MPSDQDTEQMGTSPLLANDSSDPANSIIPIQTSTEERAFSIDDHNDDNQSSSSSSSSPSASIPPSQLRKGTLSSACFNILSTMVGGGSLSLPLAFYQAGNGLLAPILLIIIAYLVQKSIHFLIAASQLSSPSSSSRASSASRASSKRKGSASYELVASAAFGPSAKYFSMALVFTICFFTIVGYGVLLRDMLLPLSDTIFPNNNISTISTSSDGDSDSDSDGPSVAHNAILLVVILLITPLCTLRNLSALESVGAASMISIFSVACIISYRSIECNFSSKFDDTRHMPWYEYVHLLPTVEEGSSSSTNTGTDTDTDGTTAWDNILNALPILISVFMCHFNVIPVHNELSNPSPSRVNKLFNITIWGACIFYISIGFIGSMYGNCTPDGIVKGNVLLSFKEDDILLLIGRACLSLTITFAFPILVVPARETFLRGVHDFLEKRKQMEREAAWINGSERRREYRLGDDEDDDDNNNNNEGQNGDFEKFDDNFGNDLSEPLLLNNVQEEGRADDYYYHEEEEGQDNSNNRINNNDGDVDGDTRGTGENQEEKDKRDTIWRIVTSTCILWIGAAIACCVKDIDIVWDFLGGSLSLIMGFLIPSASFLVLASHLFRKRSDNDNIDDDGIGIGVGVEEESRKMPNFNEIMALILFLIFFPLMFVLTGNAMYNLRSD